MTTWKERTGAPEQPSREKIYDLTDLTVVRTVSRSVCERKKKQLQNQLASIETQIEENDADLAKLDELEAAAGGS